jgi:hypothetical protein
LFTHRHVDIQRVKNVGILLVLLRAFLLHDVEIVVLCEIVFGDDVAGVPVLADVVHEFVVLIPK